MNPCCALCPQVGSQITAMNGNQQLDHLFDDIEAAGSSLARAIRTYRRAQDGPLPTWVDTQHGWGCVVVRASRAPGPPQSVQHYVQRSSEQFHDKPIIFYLTPYCKSPFDFEDFVSFFRVRLDSSAVPLHSPLFGMAMKDFYGAMANILIRLGRPDLLLPELAGAL